MTALTDKVLEFFKDICAIPHGSGNCSLVGDYLMKFAFDRNLEAVRDEKGNVLIKAPAVGKSNVTESAVILQGHQDMVCVKEDSCTIDMAKDPLSLVIEDGIISADGTSLGADDGIGVAMALAVIDDTETPRPPIEALFTVDEETGMSGAAFFDKGLLHGKKLINLDSEEEGVVTCACAGGERVDVIIPLDDTIPVSFPGSKKDDPRGNDWIKINVSGLMGGHSGCDINKGRLSAVRLITDILGKLLCYDFSLADLNGGRFDNVICSDATAVILVDSKDKNGILSKLGEIRDNVLVGALKTEKNIIIDISTSNSPYAVKGYALSTERTEEFLEVMKDIPQGVTLMMKDMPDCVDTSMNLGTVGFYGKTLKITFSLRSSNDGRRKELETAVTGALQRIKGCTWSIRDPYPAWQYEPYSHLRKVLCDSYKELFGKDMETAVTHGGLECGYFASGLKDCELVSIGPQIDDIHSVKEKISIGSIDRTVKLLVNTLKML